ncbi:MAG: serine/threonine-protein phosphatase [Candidatus Lindowbacteria bacterium]|nr:serine/threonine-protein phosphatase [Candidatus Lindowbacteria bacterium]
MKFDIAARSDIGRVRKRNEDAFAVTDGQTDLFWAVVCDGMGGHVHGDLAAQTAVAVFQKSLNSAKTETFDQNILNKISQAANQAVVDIQDQDGKTFGMGATAVCFVSNPSKQNHLVAHAGDSRLYRLRNATLEKMTIDHNLGEDLQRSGKTTDIPLSYRFAQQITRFIGSETFPGAEISEFEIQSGDIILLCSDGLYGVLPDEKVIELIDPKI